MGDWSKDSKTHVATMGDGDFRSTEQSVTLDGRRRAADRARRRDGTVTVLKSDRRRRARSSTAR
jgi:isocitrate dehydrogenase